MSSPSSSTAPMKRKREEGEAAPVNSTGEAQQSQRKKPSGASIPKRPRDPDRRDQDRLARRRTPPREPRAPEPSTLSNGSTNPTNSPPRQRKRPTNASSVSASHREQAARIAHHRDEGPPSGAIPGRPAADVTGFVKQHYNNVPERGREWRVTDSRIKGLRTYNNWVKSVLIHKCAPKTPNAKVLDIGCGKGGDLMKWQQQRIDLYVGIDPADVSIQQARERYRGMQRRNRNLFHAEFIARDGFGLSLDGVPIINKVGFDKELNQRWGEGGFDVVSMMFCMHYAFESEQKARIMLRNVAGSLKRGGRFLGVIPNSDILSAKVVEEHKKRAAKRGIVQDDSDDDAWDPEKSLDTKDEEKEKKAVSEEEEDEPLKWGNGIFEVNFPGKTPADGVFRPPYGWKYFYFLEEAVERVPEFVVPWEAFRGIAEDYNLELEYRKPFDQVWAEEKNDHEMAMLSERMGVRDRSTGRLMVTDEEMEAAGLYHAFCFYKV